MRINKFIAQATGMSRRAADSDIAIGKVTVNGELPTPGQQIHDGDTVLLDGKPLEAISTNTIIMLNKPAGYICSRNGQGAPTVYDLLPENLRHLKTVGRLDKDSSGLLLLTNNGELANELTHPSFEKEKVYQITLDRPLLPGDAAQIEQGIPVEDYISQLQIKNLPSSAYQITMIQGKNRQIRKTFATFGYTVTTLHRTQFGDFTLDNLQSGEHRELTELQKG